MSNSNSKDKRFIKMFSATQEQWNKLTAEAIKLGISIPQKHLNLQQYANTPRMIDFVAFGNIIKQKSKKAIIKLMFMCMNSIGFNFEVEDRSAIKLVTLDNITEENCYLVIKAIHKNQEYLAQKAKEAAEQTEEVEETEKTSEVSSEETVTATDVVETIGDKV